MSQKTSRKSRKHAEEATMKETEKTPVAESNESEKSHENGTNETEETTVEPKEQNSKESPIEDTKQNGTDVPSEKTEQKDVIETEKREKIEINVDVLPESDSLETIVISDSEEQAVLSLHVEESSEETVIDKSESSIEKESENGEVSEEAVKTEAKEEYFQAKDTINGNDVFENDQPENSVDNEDASTEAIVSGNDTTRNIDFTLPPDGSMERSKFLNMSKDHTVGESIKFLSSRRSIRSIRNHFPLDGVNTYTLQKSESTGYKRKYCDSDEDLAKRIKTDSAGLLSYFASPFVKTTVSSSTPKLTGFKSTNFDNTNVSKISLNDTEKTENKWCSVM